MGPTRDERLAKIRERLAELRIDERDVEALLAEVERLRSERDAFEQRVINQGIAALDLIARADHAEAALARVTDDSMADRLREAFATSPGHYEDVALATIRAVAAGEQAKGDDRG